MNHLPLIRISPFKVALWIFRRNERDVVNLYTSLSPIMRLTTGGTMLNFGYWNGSPNEEHPIQAQQSLCTLVADIAELRSSRRLIDVGSGLSAPAAHWKAMYPNIDISCVDINYNELDLASKSIHNDRDGISLINANSTALPFGNQSVDRILALESAQHFRPLSSFVKESGRILRPGGLLVIAIPVITTIQTWRLRKALELGILSFTWSSEHYRLDYVKSVISNNGFEIQDVKRIGRQVYDPLADYYVRNRRSLRLRILKQYPSFLEKILHRSLLKMRDVSAKGIIDYVIIKASRKRVQ